jgi:hypothetical protein
MPIKVGDSVKLFQKNIHVTARSEHFRDLKAGEYIVVRVKQIDFRGEGRQKQSYSTVVYPAVIAEGGSVVWEGITKTKNCLFLAPANDAANAPGLHDAPAAAGNDNLDHAVSSGESDRDDSSDDDVAAASNPRDGWDWSPCTIDGGAVPEAWSRPSTILLPDDFDRDSAFEYFQHFLFSEFIKESLLPLVNSAFRESEVVVANELFGWFAVLIAKAQWGVPDEVFWHLPIGQKLSAVMDHKRFIAIWKAMDPMRATWGTAADPHRHVTPIIEAFNARMLACFRAGKELCLNESMMLWLGKVYLMDGWVVHPRKPDPKGYEFKAVADVHTSILLHLELCGSETNTFTKLKEFFAATQSLRCAQVLRMCKPWFNTGRTVTADSGFGSPMAVALLREHGLFSNMMVKKSRYWPQHVPNDILERLPGEFDSVISCSKFIETPSKQSFKVNLTAHRDMAPRLYCHTMGVSTPHTEKILMYKRIGKKDRTVLELREVQPPQIGMHYRGTRNAVDVANDHRKHPATELVQAVHCATPQHKTLLFILACIECNAKLAWQDLNPSNAGDWWTFRTLLVDKLIHIASEQASRRRKRDEPTPEVARHHLVYVSQWSDRDKELMWPKGLPAHLRGRCSLCDRIVRSVCNCSRTTWLCDRNCFPEHVSKCLLVEREE